MKHHPHREHFVVRALSTLGLLLALAIVTAGAHAGGGPENYFLVVNSRSASSLTIANHYIALRQIPSSNVLYIDWDGDLHSIDIDTFRTRILQPTLQALDTRELTTHIDGIIYSSDFPYSIDFSGDLPDKQKQKSTTFDPLVTPPAGSINSLTYYYQQVFARQPVYADIRYQTNLYYRPVVQDTDAAKSNSLKQGAATRGFRSWYGWGGGGEVTEAGGNRYLLSTVLGLTAGKGNTTEEVVSYLKHSAEADGSAPPGTIYYTKTDDVRSKTRQPYFGLAVAELQKLGIKAEIVDQYVPTNKDDIAGGMFGHASVLWDKANNTVLPGAIVENLTSYAGDLKQNLAGQTLFTEFMRSGAAGSSGTAVEPMSIPHKFPNALVHVHYGRGCTLAEAFYQSLAAPYQLVIVGDPLCRPWAKIPAINVEGVSPDDVLKGEISIKPTASGGAGEVDRFELYLDGARIDGCAGGDQLMLDTAKLSDGFHELRVVGIESGPIETQGRLILPVTFDNHGRSMKFTASVRPMRAEQVIQLAADAPGAQKIRFYTNGRVLGEVTGEKGNLNVKATGLGSGPVTIRAIGLGKSGAEDHVLAAPVTVQIEPR